MAIYATDSTLRKFIRFFPDSSFKNTSEVLVAAGLIQIENNSTSFAGIYWWCSSVQHPWVLQGSQHWAQCRMHSCPRSREELCWTRMHCQLLEISSRNSVLKLILTSIQIVEHSYEFRQNMQQLAFMTCSFSWIEILHWLCTTNSFNESVILRMFSLVNRSAIELFNIKLLIKYWMASITYRDSAFSNLIC